MAIYELENRVYFDGAIAVDAIDISEAMEPSSDVVDADAENSIDSDSIEEYSADDFTNEPLLEVDYNNIDTLIVNLGEIDLSNFEFDLQETVENTESSDAVSSKILLVSNELADTITANDTTTVIEYSSETSLESLLEQVRDEVSELTDTDSDISADISIELAAADGNIDITEMVADLPFLGGDQGVGDSVQSSDDFCQIVGVTPSGNSGETADEMVGYSVQTSDLRPPKITK